MLGRALALSHRASHDRQVVGRARSPLRIHQHRGFSPLPNHALVPQQNAHRATERNIPNWAALRAYATSLTAFRKPRSCSPPDCQTKPAQGPLLTLQL